MRLYATYIGGIAQIFLQCTQQIVQHQSFQGWVQTESTTKYQGSKVVRAPASDTSLVRKVFCTKPTANTFRWEGRYPLIYSLCSVPLKYTLKDALFFTQVSDMGHSRTGAIQDHHPEYSYYINLDFGVLILACTNTCFYPSFLMVILWHLCVNYSMTN